MAGERVQLEVWLEKPHAFIRRSFCLRRCSATVARADSLDDACAAAA